MYLLLYLRFFLQILSGCWLLVCKYLHNITQQMLFLKNLALSFSNLDSINLCVNSRNVALSNRSAALPQLKLHQILNLVTLIRRQEYVSSNNRFYTISPKQLQNGKDWACGVFIWLMHSITTHFDTKNISHCCSFSNIKLKINYWQWLEKVFITL